MSGDVLICPDCRARVFGHWQTCKFCGTTLRVDNIDATIDPDRLQAPAPSAAPESTPAPDAGPTGPDATGSEPRAPSNQSWSSWSDAETGSGPGFAPAPGADPYASSETLTGDFMPRPDPPPGQDTAAGPWWATETDAGRSAADVTADAGRGPSASEELGGRETGSDVVPRSGQPTGSLVPLEGAEPTWVPGPPPSVSVGEADPVARVAPPDDASTSSWDVDGRSWEVDEAASGLERVSWYPEPGSSSTGGEPGPSGLEPVSWYPEPGVETRQGSEPRDVTTAGHGSGWDAPDARFGPGGTGSHQTFASGEERSDSEASFATPQPGRDPRAVPQVDRTAVNWQPAAADAWDAPVEPKGKPARQAVLSRESRLLLGGIIVALLGVVAVATIRDREASHPSEWATSVREMADWVSEKRDLPFKHPIEVVTLADGEYDKELATAARPDDDKVVRKLDDQVAMWRALGAVQGKPEAKFNGISAQRPELGAFYDLDAKRLVIRRGAEVGGLRQGLAGALSIALDDQRVSLSSLRSTGIEENPRFDVVLGTAARMRTDYADGVRDANDPPGTPRVDEPQTDAEAAFLETRPLLQSALGESFVRLVRDAKGAKAADALVTSPPTSSQQVMQPKAYLDGRGPLSVEQPEVPDGATELDDGVIGAQTWYLILTARLEDPAKVTNALAFADRWAGDSFVAYRKANGQVCVEDTIRGSDQSQTTLLLVSLHDWADSVPGGHIDIAAQGLDSIAVTACDPGTSAEQDLTTNLDIAAAAASTRSELAAAYYRAGKKIPNGVNGPVFPVAVAWCMGSQAVDLAQPDQLSALASRTGPVYRDLTLAAGSRCNSNMADQLFVEHGD